MNVFTASNNSNAAENKAQASIPRKRKQILAASIEAQEYKLRDQDWSVPSVKTSPLVCSQSNKVAQPKRKKRRTWTQAVSLIMAGQHYFDKQIIIELILSLSSVFFDNFFMNRRTMS